MRSKTKFKYLAAMLIAFIMILFFASCDSSSRTDSVKAEALLSGNVLELPIRNTANWGDYAAWGGLTFKSKKNMVKLSEEMIEQGASVITVNPYSSAVILIHKQNDNGTADDYCIRLLGTDGANSTYLFSGMEARVAIEQNTSFSILIPVHLISDNRIEQSIVTEINLGAEYETLAYWGEEIKIQKVLDLFYSFYEESGWYDLEKGDDYFIIKGNKPDLSLNPEKDLKLPLPIKVSFVKHVSLVYFIISF